MDARQRNPLKAPSEAHAASRRSETAQSHSSETRLSRSCETRSADVLTDPVRRHDGFSRHRAAQPAASLDAAGRHDVFDGFHIHPHISTGVRMCPVAGDRCDLLCPDLPRAEELRKARLQLGRADELATSAKALGDATRLTLAVALRDGGELCVCDLSWVVERSENLVSHHVRVLRAAGLVRSRREGKMVIYALTDRGEALLEVIVAPKMSV
jgi:ArsR family transcriptional regulator, lead/cadmium/zinc/bismuth-responsive transcriptional repressor